MGVSSQCTHGGHTKIYYTPHLTAIFFFFFYNSLYFVAVHAALSLVDHMLIAYTISPKCTSELVGPALVYRFMAELLLLLDSSISQNNNSTYS